MLEQVANTLLQENVLNILHLLSYYKDEDYTDSLYHPEAKRVNAALHAYVTLHALVENKRIL